MDRVILVSGANGFLGRHVLKALSGKQGTQIVGVDLQDNMPQSFESEIEYKKADLENASELDDLVSSDELHAIVHLAGVLSKDDSIETHRLVFEANTGATLNMLELARKSGAVFVFPSTGLVYGDCKAPFTEDMTPSPGDFYATSKLLSERLIALFSLRYDIRAVIFRPSIIYGPGQTGSMFIPSLIRSILKKQEFPMTPGEQTRDFIYVDDVVEAIIRAIENEEISATYNLSYGHSVSIREAAHLAESLAGVSGCIRLGQKPYREKEVWEYALDNTKIVRELGWKPKTGLEEGLKRTVEWMRKG
jgi:nucleoside-diphosphate-sugar epimerase